MTILEKKMYQEVSLKLADGRIVVYLGEARSPGGDFHTQAKFEKPTKLPPDYHFEKAFSIKEESLPEVGRIGQSVYLTLKDGSVAQYYGSAQVEEIGIQQVLAQITVPEALPFDYHFEEIT